MELVNEKRPTEKDVIKNRQKNKSFKEHRQNFKNTIENNKTKRNSRQFDNNQE